MNYYLLFCLYVLSFALFAQEDRQNQPEPKKGKGVISGRIIDSLTSKPVEFATVSLLNEESNKLIDGTITDESGKFEFKHLIPGTYKINVNFISFKSLEKGGIVLTAEENHLSLGGVLLAPDVKQLKEVVVEGQKVLIEEKVDRIVYNAENDATSKGGDATEVLRKVPMLSVDLDGNVSLRGSSNIRVLINGRPSTISAGSVADAVRQIPADQIKTVEVITSPSSKYDAEGSSGIINIVLKKNNLSGVAFGIDASTGIRGSSLGLNGNYNRKKIRFSLGGWGRAGYNIPGKFQNDQYTRNNGALVHTKQTADTRTINMFGSYNFGFDYDINDHNFINSSVRYSFRNNFNYQDKLKTESIRNDSIINSALKDVFIKDVSGTVDVSLNYTHTFKKPQHEFSILSLYSYNDRINNFENLIYTGNLTSKLVNENPNTNKELNLQLDYQNPIVENQLFEAGAKYIRRNVVSNYAYLFYPNPAISYLPNSFGGLNNSFSYDQNVTAAYSSYTLSFLKLYSIKAGVRYEHTDIAADFRTGTVTGIPSYDIVVPSINVSRRFKNGNMLKASFNRRVQRPSIQFLNPNVQAANPLNITIGNPYLEPEFTNNYELSYGANIKKAYMNLSLFARTTSDAIQAVRTVKGTDTIETGYGNIGRQDAYGFNIFSNVNPSNKFSLNGSVDLYYAILKNNVPDPLYSANNNGWVYSGRIFANYSLGKDWGLQLFAFYRGRQIQLQGYQGGFGIYSLSLKKDFNEKKGSIGFGAENFFFPYITIRNELNSPVLSQNSANVMYNLNFKINFSYRFGKTNFDAPRRNRKSVTNDDLKEGGDNGGGMPMQGGSGGNAPAGGNNGNNQGKGGPPKPPAPPAAPDKKP